ncbi:MAG: hypoxanthine phosphoribosyltransferase, partial [Dehalococcoidia bacterium]
VGLLKGAFVFMADLVRRLSVSCRCDFLAFQSYGAGTVSSGEARLVHDLTLPLAGADVLIVEDIVDTGITLRAAIERVRREHPRSLRTCTLLNKPSRREGEVPLDYVAFTVPDRFIVGYGIDWKERFRALPYIAYVESA